MFVLVGLLPMSEHPARKNVSIEITAIKPNKNREAITPCFITDLFPFPN
jgi:hypothetical protein